MDKFGTHDKCDKFKLIGIVSMHTWKPRSCYLVDKRIKTLVPLLKVYYVTQFCKKVL